MRCLIFPLLLLHFVLAAQPSRQLQYYTVGDGLPPGAIYKCLEDKKGFLWVGTETGLARFDGERFTRYTMEDGLPDNEILDIFPDGLGNLWLMSLKASPCYYSLEKDKIFNRNSNAELGKIKLRNGNLLFGQAMENGEVYYKEQSGFCSLFKNEQYQFTFDIPIVHLIPVQNGYVNIGNQVLDFFEKGHLRKTRADNRFQFVRIQPDGNGGYFCLHKNGKVFRLTEPDSRLQPRLEPIACPFAISDFFVLNNFLALKGQSPVIFLAGKKNGQVEDSIPVTARVNSVYEDSRGNIWLCTRDKGLIVVRHSFVTKKPLPPEMNPDISAIDVRQGVLYAANYSGQFFIYRNGTWRQKRITPAFANRDNDFRKIVWQGQQLYLVSSAGIYTAGKDEDVFTLLGNTAANKDLLVLNDTLLLAGSSSGIYAYNLKSAVIGPAFSKRVMVLGMDSSNNIYAGMVNGLYRWRQPLAEAFSPQNALVTSRITFLYTTPDHILWAGTGTDSLLAFKDNRLINRLSLKEIMPGNIPRCLVAAKPGEIWVATEQALGRLTYEAATARLTGYSIFSSADGLPNGLINSMRIDGDSLLLGTQKGIYVMPLTMQLPVRKNLVYITNITASGHAFRWNREPVVYLKAAQDELRIDFAAADLCGSPKVYEYQFNNSPWIRLSENQLPLVGVKPGEHHIRFRLKKWNSAETEQVTELTLFKKMPVYRDPAFIVVTCMLVVSLAALFFTRSTRLRKRKKIRKLRSDRRLAMLELEAIKANFHPHFIFNCLNSIKSLIVQNRNAEAENYLEKFSRLLRSALAYAPLKKITLQQELEFIEDYLALEKLRLRDKITYHIHVAANVDVETVQVPALFTQPYLENALKHGIRHLKQKTGEVQVQFSYTENQLVCLISDNGIGREAAAAINRRNPYYREGHGLNLAKRQARLEGLKITITDVKDDNQQIAGTMVLIQLTHNLI